MTAAAAQGLPGLPPLLPHLDIEAANGAVLSPMSALSALADAGLIERVTWALAPNITARDLPRWARRLWKLARPSYIAAVDQVLADDMAAWGHLSAVSLLHDDPVVRDAACLLLDQSLPIGSLKLAEDAQDPRQCTVDDLGVVLAGPDLHIEAPRQVGRGVGHAAKRNVRVDLFHHNLLTLHGLVTRHVAGALLTARQWLQRRAWVRRAAMPWSRPSGTTIGGGPSSPPAPVVDSTAEHAGVGTPSSVIHTGAELGGAR